jgi:hypothetical protein
MSWGLPLLPLVACLTGAAPASPDLQVRVIAPAVHATLASGSMAELAWEPTAPEALAGVEEWEAFLSVDGGRTWAWRITPHLDVALRRVRWLVPALPSAEARLLLRFGDERVERGVEVPGSFAIAAGAPALAAAPQWTFAAGEAARDGEPAVTAWVTGDRQGRRLELRASIRMAPHLAPGWRYQARRGSTAVPLRRQRTLPSTLAEQPAPRDASLATVAPVAPPAPPADNSIRLLIGRWNE